jgi:glyoxylase-like metal-dependent hydrolase (beta-lactamase superfamily II)
MRGQGFARHEPASVMKLGILPVTPFQQNASLIVCPTTGKAALVDPGGEVDRLLAAVAASGATLEKILVTHGHLDHCGGVDEIARRCGVPVEGPHRDDAFWIDQLAEQARMFGFPASSPFTPDRWLDDGDRVEVGALAFDVRHCPGHTPGHVVFASTQQGIAFVGDVLFRGSIGRSDFPRGDFATLIASITGKLWPFGDAMRFVPGHGAMSTFGAERRDNAFVSDAALARRVAR